MYTVGSYRSSSGDYTAVMKYEHNTETELKGNIEKGLVEIMLIDDNKQLQSCYKRIGDKEFVFHKNTAQNLYKLLSMGLKSMKANSGQTIPFVLGTSVLHQVQKAKGTFYIEMYNDDVVGVELTEGGVDKKDRATGQIMTTPITQYAKMSYVDEKSLTVKFPDNLNFIEMTPQEIITEDTNLDDIKTRSIDEIKVTKDDVTWLKNKKYYIVNDDEQAEKLFTYLDNYNGVISYDTETTGLKINCFSKINSSYKKTLDKYNNEHPDEKIRADRLVGIIFCIQPNVSYYFPCFNRKFKNLYEEKGSKSRNNAIDKIKARYTIGDLRDRVSEMADYVRNTPYDDWDCDVILMERCRDILSKHHIVAHNGSFDWKVGWCYEIDTNLKDDTMLLHQILYKFRSSTSNKGEPSNLKYLAKRELGMDQWELGDFFPDYKADDKGYAKEKATGNKGKKPKKQIDFSYMDYPGTMIYAPADGDACLQLLLKYKKDLMENHKEQEYIYNVEVIVACAIGYMEFYGHRIDEDKINMAKETTELKMIYLEAKIRMSVDNFTTEEEQNKFIEFDSVLQEYKGLEDSLAVKQGTDEFKALSKEEQASVVNGLEQQIKEKHKLSLTKANELKEIIANDNEHVLNLDSPAQVSHLFYNVLDYGDAEMKTQGVGKKVIKALTKEKNPDGTPKNPVVNLYSDYKKESTLLTKFFGNLPDFQYPGGYIFSSFGQVATATGRMSCKKPNAQQYPKVVSNIVIPRPGYAMIDADYSQIEYRVLVALTQEEELLKLFSDPDSDYHTLMASLMFDVDYAAVSPKMRGDAKSFNFGIPYGMGFGSLAILLHGDRKAESVQDAKEKYELYFKNQPKTRKLFEDVKEQASVNRYTETLFKRRRYYSFTDKDGNMNNAKKAQALRQAGNAVIQGCVDGDTRIQTKELGIVKIKDVINTHLMVWDGDKWSNGDILYSGKKQKCVVHFSNGQKFICSPIHKFLVRGKSGNERFVECKDLLTKENSKNPHRIVINKEYKESDWKYSSNWAKRFDTVNSNSKNVHIDDIGNSFKAGVVLGRLASDGSVLDREVGASCVLQYVAEHELNIVPTLLDYMKNLNIKYAKNTVRENRNEVVNRIYAYSKSLTKEIKALDIKHSVNDKIFMDTELLRGLLRGMFDGDGGISGKTISLTFGTQYNFEDMCRDIQKALLFFGIRSRYYKYEDRYKITIKTNDNQKFLDFIGFINKYKQEKGRTLECKTDEHLFGSCLIVDYVEITDDYIDMYDVCNTDGGYYVADGIITHNTAADVFKISVARNFTYIREHELMGDMLIINMIHDEQLMEVNVQKLNMMRILGDVGINMQFKMEKFPPLYVGAGVGPCWAKAKGGMAEIHPTLMNKFIEESRNTPIRKTEEQVKQGTDPKEIVKYFQSRVDTFRRDKIRDYILDPKNQGNILHPAIGKLINLQFTYNLEKGDLSDSEYTLKCLDEFIVRENIPGVTASMFEATETETAEVEEEDYEDNEDEEPGEVVGTDSDNFDEVQEFELCEEANKMYGATVEDLIKTFGIFVSKNMRVCGIDTTVLTPKSKEKILDTLTGYVCEDIDEGAMEVIFINGCNVANHTGLYVKGLRASNLQACQ